MPFFTERFGNANSLYALGRDAYRGSRTLASGSPSSIGAESPNEVVFTSGGTESDNAALVGILSKRLAAKAART